MSIDRVKIALLHCAKRDLRLDDDAWRNLLARVASVTSSKDLTLPAFQDLLAALEALGWKSKFGQAHFGNLRHWDFASPSQIALIRDIWAELHGGEHDEKSLNRWLARFGSDNLRFFTRDQARRAIAGLKSWQARVRARSHQEVS